MVLGKPAPCGRAFVDAVAAARRLPQPQHAMSVTPRTGLAFCSTAVLVTHSICWARCARASRGPSAVAALSWLLRHRTMPWAHRLVARVRGMLQHHGLTAGRLMVDDTDNPRSKAAQALASRSTLRATARGGYLWGHSLVLLVLVPPPISRPVGVVFSQPAPALRAGYKTAKALPKRGVPPTQRPRNPAPHPPSPPQEQLALRFLASCKAPHGAVPLPAVMADALEGPAPFVAGAAALCNGVQVLAPIRRQPHRRGGKRHQHGAASFAPHPGTPPRLRLRGGAEVRAMVGSARLAVCAHQPQRCIVASKEAEAETSRSLLASDLRGRPLEIVQGHTLRWLVAVCLQDWKAEEGWRQWTKQPGAEGARHSVILSLLVTPSLCLHPDPQRPRHNNLPAYTVGRRRANGPVECLVNVIDALGASDDPQDTLKRFTNALHEVCACGRSKKHMSQRQVGRLDPTPALQYRADEGRRTMPVRST